MDSKRRRVLYIEDDPEIQAVMDAACSYIGDIDLLITASGKIGIDLYHFVTQTCGATLDLLIIDGQLPDARGWEIVDDIRRTYGALPPVLAYPGDLSDTLRDAWNKAGVTEILRKPADLNVLVATINRLAPRAASKDTT